MATPNCEADQLTLVLIGSFNPAILQPRWMAGVDLLGPGEAEAAKITVIAADAAIFEIGDWLGIQVTSDRFHATGPFSHALKIRDFVVGLFSVLEHTPITQLGINRSMHFRLKDKTTRDMLGEKFAPAEAWPAAFATAKLQSLRKQGKRPNSSAGSLTVTIEPSGRIPEVGLFVSSHEHYELAAGERAAEMLRSNFEASVRFGLELAEMLLAADGK
jgi:hypothetical protein